MRAVCCCCYCGGHCCLHPEAMQRACRDLLIDQRRQWRMAPIVYASRDDHCGVHPKAVQSTCGVCVIFSLSCFLFFGGREAAVDDCAVCQPSYSLAYPHTHTHRRHNKTNTHNNNDSSSRRIKRNKIPSMFLCDNNDSFVAL